MFKLQHLLCLALITIVYSPLQAQHRKAQTFQQQVQSQNQKNNPGSVTTIPSVSYRILAQFDYAHVNPGELNGTRSTFLWNNTTPTGGTFKDLSGFSVGIGYSFGTDFLSIEFGRVSQALPNTDILPSTLTVQDSFEYEKVMLVYDWVFQESREFSYEIGLGVGYATKFRYSQYLRDSANGFDENVTWEANPFLAQLRLNASYHFSEHVRLRGGFGYEYTTPSTLEAKADYVTTYYGQPLVSGTKFRNGTNTADANIDISGLRANIGLTVAF